MPITEYGFVKRTYDEILTAKIEKAKELFGEDIETSELTPLGKYIRLNAYDQALTEEEAEIIYNSIFPHTAFGTSLDRLCSAFAGINRNKATEAQYVVTISGEVGAVIPVGFIVGTENGINYSVIGTATPNANNIYTTVEGEVIIGDNGTASATVKCIESGEIGNVALANINVIVNPAADIESVVGTAMISRGEETESDFELRNRYDEAKEGLGSCNETALKAALLRVPTVTHAGVNVDEDNGRFECYVSGGTEYYEEIARAIFEKKPIGIKTYGDIIQEITDEYGKTHSIRFSHTTDVPIYVRASITTTTSFEGANGKQEIKNNLCTAINNGGIGKGVILSSLYGQIHSVSGVTEVIELLLSTDGSTWNDYNITIGTEENCVCTQVEIEQNGSGYEVI